MLKIIKEVHVIYLVKSRDQIKSAAEYLKQWLERLEIYSNYFSWNTVMLVYPDYFVNRICAVLQRTTSSHLYALPLIYGKLYKRMFKIELDEICHVVRQPDQICSSCYANIVSVKERVSTLLTNNSTNRSEYYQYLSNCDISFQNRYT